MMLRCDDALGMEFSYHPVPIVFSQAKGSTVWDPEGNKYLDFLSAYSAVNQVTTRISFLLLSGYLMDNYTGGVAICARLWNSG